MHDFIKKTVWIIYFSPTITIWVDNQNKNYINTVRPWYKKVVILVYRSTNDKKTMCER